LRRRFDKSFELLNREEKGGLRVHRHRAVFGQTRLGMTFALAADGKSSCTR
jgi:hypothetical protein